MIFLFQRSGVADQTAGASDRVDQVRSLRSPARNRERDSSHQNTLLRNNNHNRQKPAPRPGRVIPPPVQASQRSDHTEQGRKSPDYYDNYDYNYYAGFEVLRSEAPAPTAAKSIQRKIHGQFVGAPGGRDRRPDSRHVSRDRERHVSREPVTDYSDYNDNDSTSDTSASTGGCLNDCVSDCVAIEQLTAYRDCVGFCGKTCKD